ncbi:PBECR4 domain-containing protein [Streptococcus pneumoniae]|nr:PBECR4 domain-containing protein [Streptococcus pneumoniae]VJT95024.1 putative conjugative transposon membrane protein [Streptococcus pneumoniae]
MVLTKAQAKLLDILEVARSLGMEMKRKSHREYYWAEHDSFKIDTVKNTWHWYSQNIFGDTINLVQQMRNVSYKEAMVFLETGSFPEAKPVEEERKPFNYTLAPYEQPFVEARTYLKEIRGLSDDTIDFFLEKGVLAQAKRKDKDGVIEDVLVFKYLDRNQQLVGASLQGLVSDQERHPGKGYLKQIMYQSEAISGLNVSIGSPNRLIVTEAPIDLMSYYELHKGELNDVRLVAMEGLKEGVLSHYVLEILQERGELAMDERDYTKPSELTRTSRFLSVAAETSTLFQDHKYDDLITMAVDRDKAGTDFISKLREKKIPVVDARPPEREGQEKTDWNEILKQEKQLERNAPDNSRLAQAQKADHDYHYQDLVEENVQLDSVVSEEKEKSLDNNQETNTGGELLNRNSSFLGVETPGTAPQPVEKNSQPDFPANVHFHFTIDEDRMSNKKFRKNMRTLNLYANAMRDSAQWYLKEMSGTSIHYVYKNPEEKQFQILNVKFDKKNWMHLTGVTPVYNEWVEHLSESFVEDVAAGKGHFKDLKFANGMSDKLKVLNLLPEVIESDSFVFNDLSSVKKFNNLDLSKAIRPEDTDLLLLFKEKEFTHVPASLMRVKGDLSKQLEDIDTGTILGVYRERDGQIEHLSINDEYVKDGGEEMLSVLRNKQYEEVPKESEQTTSVNTIDKTSLDSVTFTQVLDTVYNLGVPNDISKTPEEFHKAWDQYLDYAKKYNDKFDQIVAAAGEDHLLDTNSDFYKEWKQDHIYKENYHVRVQWAEERPDGPKLPFKETELISYQDFARELYKANQSFYSLHQEGLKQVTDGHPEGYISPTKVQFSIYAPDGELIQDSIRYNIGEEINPIAHKERLGTREMREHPELMKIDGAIFTQYHLERLASELDISQFSYALEDTPYADQLLSQVPFGVLENSPIGFSDSSHDSRLGFISFDGMDSVEVENLSAWFEKLGVKDSPMEQVALVEKWQKEIKDLSKKVEQTIENIRDEFEKTQEEEIKLEEQVHNKQELKRDADANGVSDDEELLQGTNPYDFRSKPGSKPEGEESLQEDEVVLAAGSLAVADFIQNKDMAGLSRHLKEGIKEFLDSDKYKDYLTKMSHLNNYSNRNLRLILAQNPEARQVASFKQWKENFGRYVKKGEKALRIFKPMTKIKKDENNQPILDKNGKPETVTFFGLVPVFDVSQTEGKDMPKAAEVKEQLTDLDYANLYRALMAIAKENDVSVRFEEMGNNKHGYYSVPENQIVLRSNEMNKAQIIKTFLHEMAHAELHHADNPQKENLTRSTAELQAESVAYVVSSYYGIDTSEYSFNYLSGWSTDKETLADLEAQLDIVQQEAKSLMVRMDQVLEQLRLSQEKQTKRSFEQKLEKFKEQGKQAVEEHKQELKADAQSKKEKGFSK